MSESTVLLIAAIIFFALIPVAHFIIRLRIKILRWLHWNWAANLLENHFRGFLIAFRIVLGVMGTVMLILAWTGWRS